jgi:hypothetical protein
MSELESLILERLNASSAGFVAANAYGLYEQNPHDSLCGV